MGHGGEVFVLNMGKPIKILDLAIEMIKLSGLQPNKDIVIVFTGIRPGEKLFEEMLTAEEGTIATKSKEIFIAKLSMENLEDLDEKIENLEKNLLNLKRDEVVKVLVEITPRFKPNK